MNDDEAREMLEGGPGRPAGHVVDVAEGRGPFSFGSEWSGIAKLAEELGELQTVVGKLLGTGGDPLHWQGDLTPLLEDEIADVQAALDHVLTHAVLLDTARVDARRQTKRALFRRWFHEGQANRAMAGRA